MAYVVLSYDLNEASPAVYRQLDKNLEGALFERTNTDTVWRRQYFEYSVPDAYSQAHEDFHQAILAAGHDDYHLDVLVSESQIHDFRVWSGTRTIEKMKAIASIFRFRKKA